MTEVAPQPLTEKTMPITLGCPSCGKRFRARDESAGKRVKCPYCASPVPVPLGDEAEPGPGPGGGQLMPVTPPPGNMPARGPAPAAPAPRGPGPSPLDDSGVGMVPTSPRSAPPPSVAPVADWGADDAPPRPTQPFPPPVVPPAPPAPIFPSAPPPSNNPMAGRGSMAELPKIGASRAAPNKGPAPRPGGRAGGAGEAATPDHIAIPGWQKTRAGLFWVLLALLFFSVAGFVGFAKAVCVRAGVALPKGPGGDWVSIPGYVNTPEPNSFPVSKEDMVDALAYGVPVLLGGLMLAFGRLTCGAAPRSSGAKGMFALSGIFTFLAVVAIVVTEGAERLLFREEHLIARNAFMILALTAEFWFLTGVASSGLALKRPVVPRSVGLLGLAVAFVAAVATIGWMLYTKQFRPKPLTEDAIMYEQAAVMLGWLMVVGTYWRAVRSLRGAISEFLDSTMG